MSTDTAHDWLAVETEARIQVLADLHRDETTPLEFGAPIAWVECLYGRTEALLEVHNVGFPMAGAPHTTCRERIPAPIRWLTLSPNLIRRLARCKYCEAEMTRTTRREYAA